ncbi:VPLPA-CTERM sorting domain-containing protein [Roseobacter sp. YSTF-M11]|uniref:VPLPA-CTERM sorting domain-containing protein n=1 Tax=Roseobacter insulae TaxID=2859783 RepID=A0A9X1FXQ7_9RHOB|nr:VPLPA-CTERM sorting domain-containing protein [Roseobacter insulae]MBW4709704.1 VPLPA-CTERM sorting domain-containing protein [Roseobacter insulae]
MQRFLKPAAVAAALSLAPVAVSAATYVIDFGTGATSATPMTEYAEDGFRFAVSGNFNQGVTGATLFDTTCVAAPENQNCGGDSDLTSAGSPGYTQGDNGVAGNVLIRQEAGATVPDDAATSGFILFTLLSDTPFYWVGASAVDDGTFTFRTSAFDGGTSNIGSITLGENETGSTTFRSGLISQGDWLRFRYSGSGGIDALVFETPMPVPVPAALPLMLVGMGAFGLAARHRKNKPV